MRLSHALQVAAAATLAALCLKVAPAAAMSFEKVSAGDCAERTCVLATGEITSDTAEAFGDYVRANQIARGAVVVLNSGGGNLVGGLSLGAQIRKAGLSTTVEAVDAATGKRAQGGSCASACAYAFLGGVQRTVGKSAHFGVHQLCASPDQPQSLQVSDAQVLVSLIMVHISRMGGAFEILTLALRTPPEHMRWLSPRELSQYDVVTSPEEAGSGTGQL